MESDPMLLIMCHAGANRFAFESRDVLEVLPRVNLHRLPDSPPWLAGLMIFRGAPIPVIDLTQLMQSAPCPNRLSSRIAVVEIALKLSLQRFGVLAEQMGLNEFNADQKHSGAETGGRTAMGKLCLDEQGVFQIIDPTSLVREDRLAILFPDTAGQH
ncbi:MAG: chemotaxis protein CheW [Thermoguttaceae bacterium]|jgi:chemotaxis-related protein WspB